MNKADCDWGDCARAVTLTTNGSTRSLWTHTWNSNTHEIMNETTRKTNFHDFIRTSQHLHYLSISCKRPCAIIHHQSAQNRLFSLYQVITPLENFKYLIPIFLPY